MPIAINGATDGGYRQVCAQFTVGTEVALTALAGRFESCLCVPDVLGLIGELGVGKSVFARGIISAAQTRLGLPSESIPSPSFSLMQFYPRPNWHNSEAGIWHVDAWRLNDDATGAEREAEGLGIGEALANHVCLIEWADKLLGLLPRRSLLCQIQFGATAGERHLVFTANNDFAEEWRGRLSQALDS